MQHSLQSIYITTTKSKCWYPFFLYLQMYLWAIRICCLFWSEVLKTMWNQNPAHGYDLYRHFCIIYLIICLVSTPEEPRWCSRGPLCRRPLTEKGLPVCQGGTPTLIEGGRQTNQENTQKVQPSEGLCSHGRSQWR